MTRPFDDQQEISTAAAAGTGAATRVARGRIPELLARVYRGAAAPLRARMLESLLRPVGPLAIVALAAGAFGEFLHRGGYRRLEILPEDAARVSGEQILELARYVEQYRPETFQHVASVLTENAGSVAGLGSVALVLALHAWRQRSAR